METMKHCYLLGTSIGIGYESIYHCDCPTIDKPMETIITSSFNGGDFPLELYLENLKNLMALNNSDTPPCGGCLFLRETKKHDPWRGYFDNVSITATTACNFRCSYCDEIDHHSINPDNTTYDLSATILGMCKHGLISPEHTTVHWGGGEPTMNRAFEHICRILTNNGIPQRVNTNGSIYSEAVAEMLQSSVKSLVRTSIDAGSKEVFKQIRGVDVFDNVWRNVEKYLQMGSDKMLVKYIVMPENSAESELCAFVEKCVSTGAKLTGVVHDNGAVLEGEYGQNEIHAMRFLQNMLMDAGITVTVEYHLFNEDQKKQLICGTEHLRILHSNPSEKEQYMRSYEFYTRNVSREEIELFYMSDYRAYRLSDPLYFTSVKKPHECAAYYCKEGLHYTLNDHTWSNGEFTSFEFDLVEEVNEPLQILVALREISLDWDLNIPSQIVTCEVNGFDCGSVELIYEKRSMMRFTIPEEYVKDKLYIIFRYSYLSVDTKFAVAFERMYICYLSQRPKEFEILTAKLDEIAHLSDQIQQRNTYIQQMDAQILQMTDQILQWDALAQQMGTQILQRDAQILQMNDQIQQKDAHIQQKDKQIEQIYNSRSWKIGNALMRAAAKIIPGKVLRQ